MRNEYDFSEGIANLYAAKLRGLIRQNYHLKYPIAIEPCTNIVAHGIVVPDLPGCFSASDNGVHEAIENAKEAIEAWLETALELGQDIPPTKHTYRISK